MIKFRLSDGHSYAETFNATSLPSFTMGLWAAYDEYHSQQQQSPEIQVCTDVDNEWIPINYPESNAPTVIRHRPTKTESSQLWEKTVNALLHGNKFDIELKALIDGIITERGCHAVKLELLDGWKK